MERIFERILFASRWLLAPLYFGLALLLAVFAIQFFRELLHLFETATSIVEVDLILAALTLIDMTLVASLVVMVMPSGYENFVSKLDVGETEQSLAWLGKLDAGSLKIKVAASIVAISSIHLLKSFMNYQDVANDKLVLLILTHLTFVVSALLLAVMDRILPHR
ncbi:MAG: TIGR00645 family protein [Rhizobiales bacterium]|nr:TIGR00645 family protein [Hyphomicrobiales bacterium]